MVNKEFAKRRFMQRIGDINKAQKKYFDIYHADFNADEYIETALDDCRGFFGTCDIPFAVTDSAVADIAYIRFKTDTELNDKAYGLKSCSYSEGTVSKSETYSTEQEINTFIESVLKPYNRFRVVSGHRRFKNSGRMDGKDLHLSKNLEE